MPLHFAHSALSDLTIHRILDSIFREKRPVDDFDLLANLGEHCSEQEQRAERAERELKKMKLLGYMEKRIGETMEAVVTGVEDFGIFAQGIEIPAEGLIPLNRLPDDKYDYDNRSHALIGRRGNTFRLGDRLMVEIAVVDMDERKLELGVVDVISSKAGETKKDSKPKSGKSKSKSGKGGKSKDKKKKKRKPKDKKKKSR